MAEELNTDAEASPATAATVGADADEDDEDDVAVDDAYWRENGDPTWEDRLLMVRTGKGRAHPRPVQLNATIALTYAPEFAQAIGWDEFKGKVVILKPLPWMKGERSFRPRVWEKNDDLKVTEWLQRKDIMVTKETAVASVQSVAFDNRVDTLRDWIGGLAWDGVERLETWLITYCGCADTPYIRAVSKAWMISAAARAMEPGCKVDTMLILEGKQGLKKSTVFATIGGHLFKDDIAEFGTKDSMSALAGTWIVEVAELSGMRKNEVNTVKAFMSKRADCYRPSYERIDIEQPRRCVFGGSVNDLTYLKDDTGNRRFWPAKCNPVKDGQLDVDGLAAVRDQLIAEARVRFERGEPWWLDNDVSEMAEAEQSERLEQDPWEEAILQWASHRSDVSVNEILTDAIGKVPREITKADANRVSSIMRTLGWERRRRSHGNREYAFVNPARVEVRTEGKVAYIQR